jgi:hypothetical protein
VSRRDTVTVTVTVELPERPTSAVTTFGEAQRAVTGVTRSREFTIALLVALAGGLANDNRSTVNAHTGRTSHRAAGVEAKLTTEYV